VLGVQGVGSAAVLNVMLWAALVVSIPMRGANPAYLGVALVGAIVIGGLGLIVVGIAHESSRTDRFVRALGARVRFVDPERLAAFLHGLVERFRQLATDRGLMLRATGWAAVQWLTDSASLWIFLAALGIIAPPDGLLIAFGLANVSAAIPLTPGGVGVYEAVLTSSLVGFGVPRAQAIIGVLAYRLFEFWSPIPLGAAAYLSAEATEPSLPRKRVEVLDAAYAATRAETDDAKSWASRRGLQRRRR
jgi:putative heme transporter